MEPFSEALFILISRLLFLLVFKCESGCLGLENQAFGKGGIAKINFRMNLISDDFRVDFLSFWVALGPIFMTFAALGIVLKMNEFHSDSGVTPDPGNPPSGW